jgi:Zn-dependent metalloprotease
VNIFSQNYIFWNAERQAIAKSESSIGNVILKNGISSNAQNFFSTNAGAFGLGTNDQMVLLKNETDNLGWTHSKFQQYSNNIKIVGCTYIVHELNSNVVKANGTISPNSNISSTPSLTEQNCLVNVLNTYDSTTVFLWEDSLEEYNINTTSLNTGIYVINLLVNGEIVEAESLIVLH